MDQRNQQIVHDYVSGIQTKDLAEKYNISKNQIRKIVKIAGVLRSSGGKPTYDPLFIMIIQVREDYIEWIFRKKTWTNCWKNMIPH